MHRILASSLAGLVALLGAARMAAACPRCESNLLARQIASDPHILTWLTVAAIPIMVIGVVATLAWRRAPLAAAGLMLGTGLGGFLDGILLHQLLQWHGMFTTALPATDLVAAKVNMIGDGVFHVLTWISTVAGLALLWEAAKRRRAPLSTPTFVGSLGMGWGAFNLLEGLVDHQILGIHHVHPGAGEVAWDVAFLASGALLIVAGYAMIRRERVVTRHAHAPG